jgi:hypothetical protein
MEDLPRSLETLLCYRHPFEGMALTGADVNVADLKATLVVERHRLIEVPLRD